MSDDKKLTIRVWPELHEALVELARHEHTSITKLINQQMVRFLKELGYLKS